VAETGALNIRPNWAEVGSGNRIYAEFALDESSMEEAAPLRAYSMVSAGSSPPADNALVLGLDLVLSLPQVAAAIERTSEALYNDGKLTVASLLEPCEILTKSAMIAAKKAAAELLHLQPHDGHLALWLATTQSLGEVINLDAFPSVGNQIAQSQVSVFANLPLEPGQVEDSADFSLSVRLTAVELIHELLRSAQRRDYIEFLHKLGDRP
jgi:hypothetical protein